MSQRRAHSLIEIILNTASGFVIAYLSQRLLFPFYGIALSPAQNLSLTVIFTVISLIRSYVWRRLFNQWSGE